MKLSSKLKLPGPTMWENKTRHKPQVTRDIHIKLGILSPLQLGIRRVVACASGGDVAQGHRASSSFLSSFLRRS